MSKKITKQLINKLLYRSGCTDNKFNLTRRDFIRMGLVSGGGMLMPSLLPGVAHALEGSSVHVPFLVFDLVGGAGMPANFLVGQSGGPEDLCGSYQQHGWDPRASDSLDRTFGLPMSKQYSQMLTGLKQMLPEDLSNESSNKNFKMTSICNFSLDDTDTNKSSALSLISKVGLAGEHLKAGLGQQTTRSGGNSFSYLDNPKYKPKFIGNKKDVLNMVGLGDSFSKLNEDTKNAIFKQLKDLGQSVPSLTSAYNDLSLFGKTLNGADPSYDSFIRDLYGLSPETEDGENYVQAAIAYNVIKGNTGPGVITIGDCDYHDDTQTTGDDKDLQIGRAIGRAVSIAKHLNKPLFFQIITDGGVYASSESYDRVWLGDENLHSLTVMGYFNPEKEIEIIKPQLGHYTKGGELQLDTTVGSSPEDMVRAVAANYLNIHGKLGEFEKLTGIRGLSSKELDALIGIG